MPVGPFGVLLRPTSQPSIDQSESLAASTAGASNMANRPVAATARITGAVGFIACTLRHCRGHSILDFTQKSGTESHSERDLNTLLPFEHFGLDAPGQREGAEKGLGAGPEDLDQVLRTRYEVLALALTTSTSGRSALRTRCRRRRSRRWHSVQVLSN